MPSDKERISTLEEQYKGVREDVKEIKTNHLPHIQDSLDLLDKRLDKIDITLAKWGFAVVILVAVIQFVSPWVQAILNIK